MKKIKLTRGYFVIVDDEDFNFLSQWKWSYHSAGSYAIARDKVNNSNCRILMHRLILNAKSEFVDHINGNGLDNRKINLRLCSHQENLRNRPKNINNKSGYKGVSFDKRSNKWLVQIMQNYKRFSIGLFKNKIDAAKAYDLKAKELHGQFAKLNFPDD